MQRTDLKIKIIIIALIIIAVMTIGLYIYKQSKEENTYLYADIAENQYEETQYENGSVEQDITVHIMGEVKYPGVVVLKNNARIIDAIEAAGGETEDADLNRLNLACILNDGDKIYVPNKNEKDFEFNMATLEGETKKDKQAITNINTATAEELTKLPGIGEATANKIIEYRKQNGKFKAIEELKNVPGIGDSKFENLKDKIKI